MLNQAGVRTVRHGFHAFRTGCWKRSVRDSHLDINDRRLLRTLFSFLESQVELLLLARHLLLQVLNLKTRIHRSFVKTEPGIQPRMSVHFGFAR